MNKLAVISGGTKGIGKATVEAFLEKGFDVVTCSRNQQDLIGLQEEVKQEYSSTTLYVKQADLSEKEQVDEFVSYIRGLKRDVDVLVNNTGVFIPGQIHEEEEGVLEQMINTNVYSAYHLTRGLLTGMVKQKSGHIFMICSTASITPYVNGGSYCISKYALYGMTKVLREEMKDKGVRVTAILPGATKTASWDGADIPAERFMKAEDVSKTIICGYELSKKAVIEELLVRPQLGDL
ncbi:MAG: SDR family oxidoreductase [Cyclobacteriaceae bacterium]